MVGFTKHDPLTTNQKFIAGCVSGMTTRFITQPIDVIKVRIQILRLQNKTNRFQWLRTTRHILKREGFFALWHGHNLGQIYSIVAVSSQFYVYEIATKLAKTNTNKGSERNLLTFLSGILAGCCSATLVSPLEVIRVRQMLGNTRYTSLASSARAVYQSGGLLGFYKGLSASLLMLGPQVGISFSVFSHLQPAILRFFHRYDHSLHNGNIHSPEHLILASSVAGAVAGLVSKTVTYPLDLMKKRMQIVTYHRSRKEKKNTRVKLIRCDKLLQCFVSTIKHDGLLGLYRGWHVTIFKAQMTNVVAFTTYELVCYGFRDMGAR